MSWANELYDAVIVSGIYEGRIGKATKPNEVGNVMFYPQEGKNPYCVCKNKNDIQYTGEEGDR